MAKTNHDGLTSLEVADRVARGEINRVQRSDRADYLDIAARNLFTLFNALVVPAAVALFFLGESRGAAAVSGMAVTNTVLGLIQEIRAKRHLDRLALLAETRVHVLRDGVVAEIASGDVVRGDVVLLATGDPVVADGELCEARYLEIDEALLTGESDPVPRHAGERVQSGSFAVAGEGRYIADGVGADSYAQRTTLEARRYQLALSPLQQSIDGLIRVLTVTAVVLCLIYVILWRVREFPLTDLVQMIAATITSMVPQGLVLMTTLAFVLGAVRMAARGAIVQRLSAVETMAAIDTLCLDKTGTLTTNNLRLERLHVVAADLDDAAIRSRLALFASASLDGGNKSCQALRAALGEANAELLDQLPFKSQNRYSAVRVRRDGRVSTFVLGAPESLQSFLGQDRVAALEAVRIELLKTGYRLLLFTETDDLRPLTGTLDGLSVRPLAFVALSDELRPDAGAVLHELSLQAIDFKILSGDNPDTVRATVHPLAVANDLAALSEGPVVTGSELASSTEPAKVIAACSVFGRVTPWQKVEIVTALKDAGRQVAMIGDGVNDVLPIKTAHLGIAMGEGSRAAKTVSGLVLTTNRFDLLPALLEEGRTIVRNLRRAGKLFLTKNAYILILIVGALAIFDLPFPLLPQQVTLLNFLTIGGPVLLIMLDRERAAVNRSNFLGDVGSFAIRTGVVIGVVGLGLYWQASRRYPYDTQTQRTMLLTLLVLLGLLTLLRVLRGGAWGGQPGDRSLRFFAATAGVVYLCVLYIRPTAWFFDLAPLSIDQWQLVVAWALPAWGLTLASDVYVKRGRARLSLRADRGPRSL
jgi:cation-transporting ATPase E